MNVPGKSLADWITLTIEGIASDAQREEVYAAVRRDPQARAIYIEQVLLHASLLFSAEALASPITTPRRRIGRIPGWVWRTVVAAVIVLGFASLFGLLLRHASTPLRRSSNGPVATLLDASGVVWARSGSQTAYPPTPGEQLHEGWLRIESGTLQIEFSRGAQVTLTGPAEFGLNSPMRGFLRRGKLTAYVPPQARGFTVGAPGCAVIDLGTRFVLTVSGDTGAKLEVLEGRVRLDHPGTQPRELSSGALAEVPVSGPVRIVDAADLDPTPRRSRVPVIETVRAGLLNTGFGLNAGQEDPRWEVEAVPGQRPLPSDRPVVLSLKGAWTTSSRSNWISIPSGVRAAPDLALIFRTHFDVTEGQVEDLRLMLECFADNEVRAVRLNGQPVPIPAARDEVGFKKPLTVMLDRGFRPGSNLLEVEVVNAGTAPNPIGFRAEIRVFDDAPFTSN